MLDLTGDRPICVGRLLSRGLDEFIGELDRHTHRHLPSDSRLSCRNRGESAVNRFWTSWIEYLSRRATVATSSDVGTIGRTRSCLSTSSSEYACVNRSLGSPMRARARASCDADQSATVRAFSRSTASSESTEIESRQEETKRAASHPRLMKLVAVSRSADTVDPLRPARRSGASCHVEILFIGRRYGEVVFYYPRQPVAIFDVVDA